MTDKKDPPIEPQDYIAGIKVVDIGDYRVARGLSRRAFSSCPHYALVYDANERRIWCRDCERDVEPFDAFQVIVKHFSDQTALLDKRQAAIEKAQQHHLVTLAAKSLDDAWRKKNLVPCCPHCLAGLLPDDFKNGVGLVSKSYALELARRKKGGPE